MTFNTSLVLDLLAACPAYQPTPLREIAFNGRPPLWVKDETQRMGLGAFKALGGVYAVFRLLAEGDAPSARVVETPQFKDKAAATVFVCASAGNHGMAVAAGARIFGARARIYLAETVPDGFADRLRAKGAEVVRAGADYEASVQAAIADAENTGAMHLADGSWPGYTTAPFFVMEGYTVMAAEMRGEFERRGEWPTRVFLQAGVGGLAAAIARSIRVSWAEQPELIVVEPDAAPCLAESVRAGEMRTVAGPVSNMGRLDCKTPSMLAFDILRQDADRFVTVTDHEATAAADLLAAQGIISTPSGVAGLAAFLAAEPAGDRSLIIASEGAVD